MKRRIVSFLGALLVLLALAPVAHACSCFAGDPRTRLEKSDGAFIGKLVSVDPAPPNAQTTTYHFKVDDVFKGDIGSTVDVESSTSGASCGFEVPPGEQMGFFLDREGSVWHGGLCGQVAPEDLRKAAAPLPKPNGTGPLRFLVGGAYGDVRTIGLDADGKTLRYGKGDGKTKELSVCPGSTTAAELVTADEAPFRTLVTVRDLDTFEVVRTSRINGFDHPDEERRLIGTAIACRNPSGSDVVVFGSNGYAAEEDVVARIVRVTPDGQTELWEGKGVAAGLPVSGPKAYVASRTLKLVEVDLATRAVRDIAKIPDSSDAALALSPDGRHVASLGKGYPKTDVFAVDVTSGTVKKTEMAYGGSGQMVWVSNDRVVATGGGENGQDVTVFDASLRRIDTWTGWIAAYRTICVDGTLYGTSFGRFVKAAALKGPMKEVRSLGSPELEAIAAVPPAPEAPKASPTARPKTTTEPTTAPTAAPEATATPAGFAAPTSAPSEPTGGSSALPAAALAVSALALGGAAFTWRRRSA